MKSKSGRLRDAYQAGCLGSDGCCSPSKPQRGELSINSPRGVCQEAGCRGTEDVGGAYGEVRSGMNIIEEARSHSRSGA